MTTRRSARRGSVIPLLSAWSLLACAASAALGPACTLTHPLDEYHAGSGGPADAAGGIADTSIPDTSIPDAGIADAGEAASRDAGDGCEGNPRITQPVNGATVGASVRLTASAPGCIMRMILYVDSVETLYFTTSSVDQDVPIALGSHTLSINGWAGTDQAHVSPDVQITRPQ